MKESELSTLRKTDTNRIASLLKLSFLSLLYTSTSSKGGGGGTNLPQKKE